MEGGNRSDWLVVSGHSIRAPLLPWVGLKAEVMDFARGSVLRSPAQDVARGAVVSKGE
jgi:hypothetical protein